MHRFLKLVRPGAVLYTRCMFLLMASVCWGGLYASLEEWRIISPYSLVNFSKVFRNPPCRYLGHEGRFSPLGKGPYGYFQG